jgi:predicted transglutaminase-like cysteine proteinase
MSGERHLFYNPTSNQQRIWIVMLQFFVLIALADESGVSEAVLARVAIEYGNSARSRVELWGHLIHNIKDVSAEQKLEQVNDFFNELDFVSDQSQWGKSDYWATPIEFLSIAGGDCEDFSVAKYFTLRELGIPVEKLRLTYVKAVKLRQAHMVLAYYPTIDAEPLVLDNLIAEIKPASLRKDLLPVYSFNGDGLWLAKQRGSGRKVGNSDRLSNWNDLSRRMKTLSAGIGLMNSLDRKSEVEK